jgi:hypothetical protein
MRHSAITQPLPLIIRPRLNLLLSNDIEALSTLETTPPFPQLDYLGFTEIVDLYIDTNSITQLYTCQRLQLFSPKQ